MKDISLGDAKPRISLEMKLTNHWPKIELVRNAVAGFIKATMVPVDVVDKLAIASAELLENALKFSEMRPGEPEAPITFLLESDAFETRVIVSNYVNPNGVSAERLLEVVKLVGSNTDLEPVYRERLESVFAGAGSGIGLIRLGRLGCSIDVEMDGDQVCIRARFPSGDISSTPTAANA